MGHSIESQFIHYGHLLEQRETGQKTGGGGAQECNNRYRMRGNREIERDRVDKTLERSWGGQRERRVLRRWDGERS